MQLNLFDYHMISAFYYAIKQFHALKETNQRNMQWTILENLMPERIRVD